MCQIDWEDSSDRKQMFCGATKPHHKTSVSLIATLLGLQVGTLFLIPSAIFAEMQSTSVQEDIPEEVLRTEIYTDARSPIDGTQLSAAEYAELMEKLRSLDNIPPEDLVSPKVREVIDLLKLRKFLRQFIPFIP